jgi:hypothetical protein
VDLVFPATKQRIAEWTSNDEVLGVLLVGSRSRRHADELSDDDLEVILTDEAAARLRPADCSEVLIEGEGTSRRMIYDAQYLGISDLRAKLKSHIDLDRWPYESAPVLFDRTGDLPNLVADLGRVDAEFRARRLRHATIDAMVAPYRAVKCRRRGQEATVRLLVARGARALSRLIFALEWRWVPMDHWLEPELRTLEDPAGAGRLMLDALNNADPDLLKQALDALEPELLAEGVPGKPGRNDLFMELIHPGNVEERLIHGLQ